MVSEQKARAVYENLIDLTTDPDVIAPLLWLRQREIVHFERFRELFEHYQKMFKNGENKMMNPVKQDDINNLLFYNMNMKGENKM